MPEYGTLTITYILHICTKIVEGTSSARGTRAFTGKQIMLRKERSILLEDARQQAEEFKRLNPELMKNCVINWQAQPYDL